MSSDDRVREVRSQYRDDRNLARRQSLFSYAVGTTGSLDQIVGPFVASGLVLDVGCGNGLWPSVLTQRGSRADFVGVDTSLGMVKLARQQPGTVAVAQADICALPFADGTVDTVLALWMLYHVADKTAALREVERVKRPTGYFVAVTNGSCDTPLQELIVSALSATVGKTVESFLPPLDFTSENGTEILGARFAECRRVDWETRFELPNADPIIGFVESLHEPIEAFLGPVDWVATHEVIRARADDHLRRTGHIAHELRQSAFLAR